MQSSIFTKKFIGMRKIIWLLLVSGVFISSCKKDDSPAEGMPVTMMDVSYGPNAQQKMDVYLPAQHSTTATKVMIMIHGGAWNTGDKSDFNSYVDSMKRREPTYAIININYRLANAPNLFPAQEEDVKLAVEYIYSKRSQYGISDKFVLVGGSAGAHLALLQGYKYSAA